MGTPKDLNRRRRLGRILARLGVAVLIIYTLHLTQLRHCGLPVAVIETKKHAPESSGGTISPSPVLTIPIAKRAYTHSVGRPKCYNVSMADHSAPCAACVHFISIANRDSSRWASMLPLLSALHIVATNLRLSQRCFALHLYTNVALDSAEGRMLQLAGGTGVRFYPFPTDLPRNGYSDRWHELSRRKLDLAARHTALNGHKVIWTDLDTVVLTDLSCAYAQLANFVVSRDWSGHSMAGPNGNRVAIRDGFSVYGDLWMADTHLIEHVHRLEASGMPPPMNDIQDHFAYLLNQCDGTVTDLRGFLRDADRHAMCFGFDHASGHHPYNKYLFPMRVVNSTLQCSVAVGNELAYYNVASMSFIFPLFVSYLDKPRTFFRTDELMAWAHERGFRASNSTWQA